MKAHHLLLALVLPLIPTSIASAETLSVKAQSANFRKSPSDKGTVVFAADKYYPVEVLDRHAGWVKVRDFEGDTAWVAERVLAKDPTVVIEGATANIREKATEESDILFKVAHGEVFKIVEKKGNWLKVVDARGDGGFIRADKVWGAGLGKKLVEHEGTCKAEEVEKTEHAELNLKGEKGVKVHVDGKGTLKAKSGTKKIDKKKKTASKSKSKSSNNKKKVHVNVAVDEDGGA